MDTIIYVEAIYFYKEKKNSFVKKMFHLYVTDMREQVSRWNDSVSNEDHERSFIRASPEQDGVQRWRQRAHYDVHTGFRKHQSRQVCQLRTQKSAR